MERPRSPHTNISHEPSSPIQDSRPDRQGSTSPQLPRHSVSEQPIEGESVPRESPPPTLSPQQSKPLSEEFRPQPPTRASTASEPKKCWICYSDATEDDPENPPQWRSPCPCALVAHESCLLDWIADIENPKNKNPSSGKIQCPQCKGEIKVERPRSLVLAVLRYLDRLTTQMIIPGIATVLIGTTWAGLRAHGQASMYAVFGYEETKKIFESMASGRGWLNAGLPLIPLALIAQRTRYSALLSPISIICLSVVQSSKWLGINPSIWPASSASIFACLPIVHGAYNQLYDRVFGELNKKWLAEVQPRAPEGGENAEEGDAEALGRGDEGGVVVDFNIEIDFAEGEDNNNAPQRPPLEERQDQQVQGPGRLLGEIDQMDREIRDLSPVLGQNQALNRTSSQEAAGSDSSSGRNSNQMPDQAREQEENPTSTESSEPHEPQRPPQDPPPQNENPAQNPDRNENPDQNANPAAPPADPNNPNNPQNLLNRRGEELFIDSTSIAQTVLGGLVFPAVSSAMGQFLFYTLPSTLTSHGSRVRLLETKWGRSVVGGALFIVLRDVVMTYSRWRLAKGHRMRRVVDFRKDDID